LVLLGFFGLTVSAVILMRTVAQLLRRDAGNPSDRLL
jgi:hypothetical protein